MFCFILFPFVDEEVELQLRLGLCRLRSGAVVLRGGQSTNVKVWPQLASSGQRTSMLLIPLEQGR